MTTQAEYETYLLKMLQQEHDSYQQRVAPLLQELEHLRALREPMQFSVRVEDLPEELRKRFGVGSGR